MSKQRITWICDIHGTAGESFSMYMSNCLGCCSLADMNYIMSIYGLSMRKYKEEYKIQKERYESDENNITLPYMP